MQQIPCQLTISHHLLHPQISTSTPMSPRQKMKRKLRNVICCLKTKANFEISIVMGQEAQNMGYKVENNALTNKVRQTQTQKNSI